MTTEHPSAIWQDLRQKPVQLSSASTQLLLQLVRFRSSKMLLPGLTEEQSNIMKIAFKEADTEGTGKLTASQLKDVFNAVTTSEWDEELVTLFMRIVDTDGDRMLNYDQLTQLFSDEDLEPEQLFKMLFKMLDTNRDGKLCKQELSQLFKIFEDDADGDRMSEENQQKMKGKSMCPLSRTLTTTSIEVVYYLTPLHILVR